MNETLNQVSIFKVLGVNDESDCCDCCGKAGLKKVVWIQNTETGNISHFGVVCALNPAKCFGLDSEIKKAQADFKSMMDQVYRVAFNLYRKAGGKYVSNGIPLNEKGGALVCADQSLYDICLANAKSQFH